jgi:hypothetical protein
MVNPGNSRDKKENFFEENNISFMHLIGAIFFIIIIIIIVYLIVKSNSSGVDSQLHLSKTPINDNVVSNFLPTKSRMT